MASPIYRDLLVASGTLILTAGGFWLIQFQQYVTAPEVRRMLNEDSPYVRDRNSLMERMAETSSALQDIAKANHELSRELANIRGFLEGRTRVISEISKVLEEIKAGQKEK